MKQGPKGIATGTQIRAVYSELMWDTLVLVILLLLLPILLPLLFLLLLVLVLLLLLSCCVGSVLGYFCW